MSKKIWGYTISLKPYQKKILENLYKKRIFVNDIVSDDVAHTLCALSYEFKKQVGVLVSRKGVIEYVIVGTPSSIRLPDFGRIRAGKGRLRGLRFIHTHLHGEELSSEDFMDMLQLRLDYIAAITFKSNGMLDLIYGAYLAVDFKNRKLISEIEKPINFYSKKIDFLQLVKLIESDLKKLDIFTPNKGERALLIHADFPTRLGIQNLSLDETTLLAKTAGIDIVDFIIQKRVKPDPKYFIGQGKLEEIIILSMELNSELIIFNQELSPGQVKAITDMTDLRVIDRTMLILAIFAKRAMSRDGRIQVELAQLKYRLPRLIKQNSAMNRLVGFIGGKGPGEKKLEIDRRRIKDRISALEKQIKKISKRRERTRIRRKRNSLPVISLVGYTNAGKSTLLNTITNSSVYTCNELFATLDPTVRRVKFPENREILITDTVGFIHHLPVSLTNAFKATLEEIGGSDLIVHVIDISSKEFDKQMEVVNKLLETMGFANIPMLYVFNKTDLLDNQQISENVCKIYNGIAISALKKQGIEFFVKRIEEFIDNHKFVN